MPPASKYDPCVDYAWKTYYEMHKGESFADEAKKIIESLNQLSSQFYVMSVMLQLNFFAERNNY